MRQAERGVAHLDALLVARYHDLLGGAGRVLDLGCGFGSLGRWRPAGPVRVFGLDGSGRALREAARWEFVARRDFDEERLPLAACSFDAVLAKDVLEHLLRPWRLLAEVLRALVPGGRVLVSTPLAKPAVVWNDHTHVRRFTCSALRQRFEDCGFEVVQLIRMDGLRGVGRLRLARFLPAVMQLPVLGAWLAVNHATLARKPE